MKVYGNCDGCKAVDICQCSACDLRAAGECDTVTDHCAYRCLVASGTGIQTILTRLDRDDWRALGLDVAEHDDGHVTVSRAATGQTLYF